MTPEQMEQDMNTDHDDELKRFVDGIPAATWWKRLPIIRHIRAIWLSIKLERHYSRWAKMGAIPWGAYKDYAVLDAIWRGEK